MIQLADGDPRGWIPARVVSFVASQGVPNSFIKLNKLVRSLPSKDTPDCFLKSDERHVSSGVVQSNMAIKHGKTFPGTVNAVQEDKSKLDDEKDSDSKSSLVEGHEKKRKRKLSSVTQRAEQQEGFWYIHVHRRLDYAMPYMIASLFLLALFRSSAPRPTS
jgi:hypothetical protein